MKKLSTPKLHANSTPSYEEIQEANAQFGGGGAAPTAGGPTADELAEANAQFAPASAATPSAPSAPEPEAPGMLESGLRGAGQGASMGFSDEIAGLGKALFGDIKNRLKGEDTRGTFGRHYTEARDEERKANDAAREANPWTYGLSEAGGGIASSFIPGLGIAKGANTALKVAGSAAKLGAISGTGYSNAEDLGGLAMDAGKSALVSGGTAGVLDKILKGAPGRMVQRKLGDITDGVPANMRDRLAGRAGSNVDNVVAALDKHKAIAKAVETPEKLAAVEDALGDVMGRINHTFKGAGQVTEGIKPFTIGQHVQAIANDIEKSSPGKAPIARAVRSTLDDVMESWGDKKFVSAQDVRELARDVGDAAFAGSPAVDRKAGKVVAQDVWKSLKGLIDQNIDEAATKMGGHSAVELRALNKEASTLMNMRQSLQYKATRESSTSTRLSDRISGGLDMGLALSDPSLFIAKKSYDLVGKHAVRAADDKLAKLVTMANNGSKPAQLAERAIMMGFSPVVAKGISNWLDRSANNLAGPMAPPPELGAQ